MITKISLDVNNTDEVPEELYEILIDCLIAKAGSLGIDLIHTNLMLDKIQISSTIVPVSDNEESDDDAI
jgi:hypothetical protein